MIKELKMANDIKIIETINKSLNYSIIYYLSKVDKIEIGKYKLND